MDLTWEKEGKVDFVLKKKGVELGRIIKMKAGYWVIYDRLINSEHFNKLADAVSLLKSVSISQ